MINAFQSIRLPQLRSGESLPSKNGESVQLLKELDVIAIALLFL